jgi:hypothetical protein
MQRGKRRADVHAANDNVRRCSDEEVTASSGYAHCLHHAIYDRTHQPLAWKFLCATPEVARLIACCAAAGVWEKSCSDCKRVSAQAALTPGSRSHRVRCILCSSLSQRVDSISVVSASSRSVSASSYPILDNAEGPAQTLPHELRTRCRN